MPNCSDVAVMLIQVHYKIKNYFLCEAINIIQNVKSLLTSVLFLRSYRVTTCSFTKYKTPPQVFFHSLQ